MTLQRYGHIVMSFKDFVHKYFLLIYFKQNNICFIVGRFLGGEIAVSVNSGVVIVFFSVFR